MAITRKDLIKGGVGLVTGGPIGAIASPMVGRAVNGNWKLWALIGVVAGPAAWFLWSIPVAVITFDPSKVSPPPASTPGSTPAPTPPALEPEAAEPEPAQPTAGNTTISDNLNAADVMFKAGMDGCTNVSVAISAANSPGTFGVATAEQRNELKSYAARCNLRF